MDTNQEIRQFIDDMPDDYGFSKDDAKYISRYDGCPLPPFAYISLIETYLKKHFPFISMKFHGGEFVRALCYGYGSDMVLSNTNAVITSYQDDYYCFRVSQGIHYDKVVEGEHYIAFRNLADYFIEYKGNNKTYDIVITFPQDTIYHKIDSDAMFSNLSAYAYYSLRGAFFLKPKGVLFSVVPSEYAHEIKSNENLISSLNATLTITDVDDEYAIVKIMK